MKCCVRDDSIGVGVCVNNDRLRQYIAGVLTVMILVV